MTCQVRQTLNMFVFLFLCSGVAFSQSGSGIHGTVDRDTAMRIVLRIMRSAPAPGDLDTEAKMKWATARGLTLEDAAALQAAANRFEQESKTLVDGLVEVHRQFTGRIDSVEAKSAEAGIRNSIDQVQRNTYAELRSELTLDGNIRLDALVQSAGSNPPAFQAGSFQPQCCRMERWSSIDGARMRCSTSSTTRCGSPSTGTRC